MKKKLIFLPVFLLAIGLVACDENEIMPSYKKVGTATATIVNISLSNDEPAPLTTIEVVVSYVNPSVDPLQTAALQVKVGDNAFAEVQSWNVTSDTKDQMITHTVNYEVPDAPGAPLVFDVVLTSGREFPQRKRAQADVAEE